MKANNPLNQDESLRALLGEWKADGTLPPRFQEQVWRRIDRERTHRSHIVGRWERWSIWIGALLPRPALAVACVTALLIAGAGLGWAQAHSETSRVQGDLAEMYVRSVDPYQNVQ